MNAIVLYKSDFESHVTLQFEKRPIPVPSESEVLIKVHASKLNPSDLLNASGGFPYTVYPRIPGRDYAGVVVKAPGHPGSEGQNVFGSSGNTLGFTVDGAHAEHIVVPSHAVSKMPSNLTYQQAGCLGVVYGTALMMIQRAQIDKQGGSALIIGESGNVGTAIKDILRILYPSLLVTAANRVDGKMSFPQADKFDVIFSTVPDTASLQKALHMLNKSSKLIFIATTRPKTESLEIDPMQFYRDDLSLIGVNSLNISLQENKLLMDDLSDLFKSGKLKLPTDKEPTAIPFRDAKQSYEQKVNAVFLFDRC